MSARTVVNDRWVLERRGPKATLDPMLPYATAWEEEPDASLVLISTAVVFLTNRECPFRCVMCDLWVNTLDETVPRGAIPAQIRAALANRSLARPAGESLRRQQIKLYNAGSFFDPNAIPPAEDEEIASVISGFDRVIVEAHPAFLSGAYAERCLRFRDLLNGRLEVAIGLETAHPEALARLNKRMTVDGFRRAAAFLTGQGIDVRAFILLAPPFERGDDTVRWACRSLDVAMDCGASVCSIIPTRSGNGAMEALVPAWAPPRLHALEATLDYGLSLGRGRVFADLWDIGRLFDCECSPARAARLRQLNVTQRPTLPVKCDCDLTQSTVTLR
jgi:radical SAM enzyme (TIGR01210 family)